MKNFNLNKILYLYIIITIFFNSKFSTNGEETDGSLINMTRENCSDEECFIITIDMNGTINKDCIKNEYNKENKAKIKKTSIFSNNTFIIFDCISTQDEEYKKCYYKYNSKETNWSISDEPSPSNCKKNKKSNNDNDCCYLVEKNDTDTNFGCIEVNKYEYEKFKWSGIIREQFGNLKDLTEAKGYIECNSHISKINILILISIFIFYF